MNTFEANTDGNLIVNGRIPGQQLRVIFPDGKTSIMSKKEALDSASNLGLDLVLISQNNDLPVTKIVDLGKFKFELQKKTRDIRRSQREARVETKELRFRPVTGDHDVQLKINQAKKFLSEGDKVRLTIRFKGREIAHKDVGRSLLATLINQLGEYQPDGDINDGGREIFVIITPKQVTKINANSNNIV